MTESPSQLVERIDLTREEIEDWRDTADSYGQEDGQWIPMRDAFVKLCDMALRSLQDNFGADLASGQDRTAHYEVGHVLTDRCGYDRVSSVNSHVYCCACGWSDPLPVEHMDIPAMLRSPNALPGESGLPEPMRWHWSGPRCHFVDGRLTNSLEHGGHHSKPSPAVVLWTDYDDLRSRFIALTQKLAEAEGTIQRVWPDDFESGYKHALATAKYCDDLPAAIDAMEMALAANVAQPLISECPYCSLPVKADLFPIGVTALREEITRLRTELAASRADAERYQWLRQFAGNVERFPDDMKNPDSPDDMDAQIDRALAAKAEGDGE